MKIKSILLLCFGTALLCSRSSRGDIYIDGYNAGQFVPGAITGTLICTNESASNGDILGGKRNVQTCGIDAFIGNGQTKFFINSSSGNGFLSLTYAGDTGAYNGIGDVDLTQGGTNNCFRIYFTSVNNAGGSLTFTLRNVTLAGSTVTVPLPPAPGPLIIPFGSFQTVAFAASHLVNFNDVGYIDWTLQMNSGESYTMGPVAATFLPSPKLTITASGGSLILTWPTNAIRFVLQSTTDLSPSAVWSTNLPLPVIVDGQNAVTNQMSGEQMFFRLRQSF